MALIAVSCFPENSRKACFPLTLPNTIIELVSEKSYVPLILSILL